MYYARCFQVAVRASAGRQIERHSPRRQDQERETRMAQSIWAADVFRPPSQFTCRLSGARAVCWTLGHALGGVI
jgi:hypothetical protein